MSYQHSYCWLVSWFSPFMWHLSPPQVLYHCILTAPESLSTSSEFSFFFFSTIILFVLNRAAFSSLFSLFLIFFPLSWSSKQLRGVHHFYWTHKLLFPHRVHLKLSHVRHLKKLRVSKTKLNLLSPLFIFCICWEHHNPPGSQPIHRNINSSFLL